MPCGGLIQCNSFLPDCDPVCHRSHSRSGFTSRQLYRRGDPDAYPVQATLPNDRCRHLNFVSSIETIILHFCIQQYLCSPMQRYHITDLSKGAMLVQRAGVARTQRYDRWYGLLLEELDLVAPLGAGVFAVGNAVAEHLERRAFPRPFTKVIHYSGVAAWARATGIIGHEDSFETLDLQCLWSACSRQRRTY